MSSVRAPCPYLHMALRASCLLSCTHLHEPVRLSLIPTSLMDGFSWGTGVCISQISSTQCAKTEMQVRPFEGQYTWFNPTISKFLRVGPASTLPSWSCLQVCPGHCPELKLCIAFPPRSKPVLPCLAAQDIPGI